MTFDWFTLVAQLVNFGLLVLLLRVFLYGPIRRVMEEREARIREAWEEAQRAKEAAREQEAALEAERADVARERGARLTELEEEIEARRQARLEVVEREVQETRERLTQAWEEDRAEALRALRQRGGELLLAELRAALRDLADADLDRQAAAMFRRRLQALDDDTRQRLREAADEGIVEVTTAFEADEAQRRALTEAVHEVTGPRAAPRFTSDRELLFGVALTAGGMRVGFTGADRLEALEEAFGEALEEAHAQATGDAPAVRSEAGR